MRSGDLVLMKWRQRSAWASEFKTPRRNPGDTDITTYQAARNLEMAKLVAIVGPAEDDKVVHKVCETMDGGGDDGSVSSDNALSPVEG